VPVFYAVVQSSRTHGVDTVLIVGATVLRDRKFTRVDKHAAQEDFARQLRVPLTPQEERRINLSRRLFS
jgi:hypothetical protein